MKDKRIGSGYLPGALVLAVLLCVAVLFRAQVAHAQEDPVTFSSYSLQANRLESMGTPPNGTSGTDGCSVEIDFVFDDELELTDAKAAAASFQVGDTLTVQPLSYPEVQVRGNVLEYTAGVTFMPGGIITFKPATIEGVTCGGKPVCIAEDFMTVVPTGLRFHVTELKTGTETEPASVTIEIDKSAVVRSMNHILWTSNGESLYEGTGTAQTTAAHHHNYWSFTLKDSADFIKAGFSADGYSVTVQDDTVTLKANKAVPGEYLGIYNYDDNFLKQYGFALSDHVSGLAPQTPDPTPDIAERCVVEIADKAVWTGAALEPEVKLTDGFHNGVYSYELTRDQDYIVTYENNTDWKSTARVLITDIGSYKGTIEKTFRITKDLTADMFEVDTADETFKGGAYLKEVTSPAGLVSGKDYAVSYQNNAFPGTSTIRIDGIGDYSGSLEYTYTIHPVAITEDMFTVDTAEKVYTGGEIRPDVALNGVSGVTYKAVYSDNINAGTGTITVTGTKNYGGELIYTFPISRAPLSRDLFKVSTAARTYTGKALKAAVTSDLVKGTDYTLRYSDNVKVGKASVTITGAGNYQGTLTYTYTIKPAKAVITKAACGKKKLTLKWKDAGAASYQVFYRASGSGKWSKKTVKTTSAVLKSLKKGKKYQVYIVSVSGKYKIKSSVRTTGKIR